LEAEVVMGLRHLADSVISLPALESREVDGYGMLSPVGQQLAEQIMSYMCDMREGEDEAQEAEVDIALAFLEAYPAFFKARGWHSGLTDSEKEVEEEEEAEGEGGVPEF
jgi:hypothetical protein